jgi:hypothetical protein
MLASGAWRTAHLSPRVGLSLSRVRVRVHSQREEELAPETVLFFIHDKFGKWDLGVNETNSSEAQRTLRVLSQLHRSDDVKVFRDVYYSSE